MAITFHSAQKLSSFADLFSDDNQDVTWYRLWTGDAEGNVGSYVDTGAFNRVGKGWIEKDDLPALKADFAQADDTDLWVQTWNAAEGNGPWSHAAVDFTDIEGVGVATTVTGDTALDQIFTNANVDNGTWYQVWLGDGDGSGQYLNTPTGNGWIRPAEDGGGLSGTTFPAADLGQYKEMWVRTWTETHQYTDWEHWTVTTTGESDLTVDDVPPGATDIFPACYIIPNADGNQKILVVYTTLEKPPLPEAWTDSRAGSTVDVSAADIISSQPGDTIDFSALVAHAPGDPGFSAVNEIDTRVTDDSVLGEASDVTYYTGNYDADSGVFTSADDAGSADVLVVYDNDAGGVHTDYDMIVLLGASDVADADGDAIFTVT